MYICLASTGVGDVYTSGYSINYNGDRVEKYLDSQFKTSIEAEVNALYYALNDVPDGVRLEIYCKCGYIVETLLKYLDKRRSTNWMQGNNKEYKYADLWRSIDRKLVNSAGFSVEVCDTSDIKKLKNRLKEAVGQKVNTKINKENNSVSDGIQPNDIVIYCDGGCRGNGKSNNNVGGWGSVLSFNGKSKELCGYEKDTTNNIMELKALIESLKAIKNRQYRVMIFTDSTYVCKGVNEWMASWKNKGWKKSGGELLNKELWIELDSLLGTFNRYNINWVKGHASNQGNNRADELANMAMDELERKIR